MNSDKKTFTRLMEKSGFNPRFSILLGTGFEIIENAERQLLARISYEEAGFKVRGSVDGHSYHISLYQINDKPVLVFHGRLHLYEGYEQTEVIFPVEYTYQSGINKMLLTCASGGLSEGFYTGDIVLVSDHINLTGGSPLLKLNPEITGSRFLDLSNIYKNSFCKNVENALKSAGIGNKKAVLVAVTGPNYETTAEARFLKRIGADIVSMSVVPEAIFARYREIEVSAISVISNHHFKDKSELSHSEIINKIKPTNSDFNRFLDHLADQN